MRYVAKITVVYLIILLWFLWENKQKLSVIALLVYVVTIMDFVFLKVKCHSKGSFALRYNRKERYSMNPPLLAGSIFTAIGAATKETYYSFHGINWMVFLGFFFFLQGLLGNRYPILLITKKLIYINEGWRMTTFRLGKIDRAFCSYTGLELYTRHGIKRLDLSDRAEIEIEYLMTHLNEKLSERLTCRRV